MLGLLSRLCKRLHVEIEIFKFNQSRSRKSAHDDKWSFCLSAGTLSLAPPLGLHVQPLDRIRGAYAAPSAWGHPGEDEQAFARFL